jgi:hypothetical protein
MRLPRALRVTHPPYSTMVAGSFGTLPVSSGACMPGVFRRTWVSTARTSLTGGYRRALACPKMIRYILQKVGPSCALSLSPSSRSSTVQSLLRLLRSSSESRNAPCDFGLNMLRCSLVLGTVRTAVNTDSTDRYSILLRGISRRILCVRVHVSSSTRCSCKLSH